MHPTGHRGAHGQGARSQVDAQGWSGESGRTHSACHYTLARFPALKVWQTHLKLSEPGERLLKHRASEPPHDEMFSYDPLHGGSLRPNCSGCQFGAKRPKTSGGICSQLLGRAGARALQDRIARIALRRGPHRRCVAAQGYRRNSLPLSKCSYAYGDVSPRETKSHESCTG